MANLFAVEFLNGTLKTFYGDRLKGLFEEKVAIEKVKELKAMGFPAMKVNPKIGGFEYYGSPVFNSEKESDNYFTALKNEALGI